MRHLTIFALFISAVACSPMSLDAAQNKLVPRPVEGANNDLDVNYLQPWRDVPLHSGRGPDFQTRLNVHWPQGEGPFPCLIFVHGGGYGGGHKDIPGPGVGGDRSLIEAAVRQGFVAVNVNYILGQDDPRWAGREIFPQVYYDFRAAVRFLRKNANKYRIDPSRMAAWGYSAGGWLVSSCSYPDAGNFLTGINCQLNNWIPVAPEEVEKLPPTDPGRRIVQQFVKDRRLLLPMDDPRPLYGGYSSRLQAICFDYCHHPGAATPDDPATLTFVGEGATHKHEAVFREAGIDFLAVTCLDPKLKGADILHCPNFAGPSIGEDGKTPVTVQERVFQFLRRQLVDQPRTPAVEFRPNCRVFEERTRVEMIVPAADIKIRYTLDGSEPTTTSQVYSGPLSVGETTTVRARAFREGWRPSGTATATFYRGPLPPGITGPDVLPPAKVGQPYRVEFGTEGNQTASWALSTALVSGSPAFHERWHKSQNQVRQHGLIVLLGLEFDCEKGVLAGKPNVPGYYVLLVQAGRSYGQAADTRTYVLHIKP